MLWVSENRRRVLAGALATVCLLVIGFAAGHATKSGPEMAQAAQRVKTVVQTKTITDAPASSTPATSTRTSVPTKRTKARAHQHRAGRYGHAEANHDRSTRKRATHTHRSGRAHRSRRCVTKAMRSCRRTARY